MPSGPAFEDEAEFEKELSTLPDGRSTQPQDEDDFDFEPAASSSTIDIAQKLQDVLKQAEREEVVVDEVTVTTVNDVPTYNQEERINILAASQAAFEDIAEVYRTGLGDHEVAIMQSTVTLQDITLETGAIAEVDEEAVAAQEEEEERAALAAMEAEKQAKENLEKEWESVSSAVAAAPADPSVTLSNKRICYKEAEAYFRCLAYFIHVESCRSLDLSEYRDSIVTREEESTGFLKSIFAKREKLSFSNHETELELPFLIAQVAYSPENNEMHAQIMRSIFEVC